METLCSSPPPSLSASWLTTCTHRRPLRTLAETVGLGKGYGPIGFQQNMQNEHGYETAFSNFKFLKMFENGKNNHHFLILYFLILKKRNTCIRILSDEYVCKISSRYLLKQLSFAVLNDPKRPLLTPFTRISIFPLFPIFIWFGQFKKCSRAIFAFLTKILPRNMYHTTQPKYPKLDLFDLVTLDDLDLTQVTKG